MGRGLLASLILFVSLSGTLNAQADVYLLTAWQRDGNMNEELRLLGNVTENFISQAQEFKAVEKLDGDIRLSQFKHYLKKLSLQAENNRKENQTEQVLYLAMATHGHVYEGIHYLSIHDSLMIPEMAENCVKRVGPLGSVAECGMLSSLELADILKSLSFDKIVFITGACYGGQIVSDFSNILFRNKVVVITATDAEHVAIHSLFEKQLEMVFKKYPFESFEELSDEELLREFNVPELVFLYSPNENYLSFGLGSKYFTQKPVLGFFGVESN